MQSSAQISFEQTYDKYSAMVYGLALKMTDSQKDAEEVLVNTFINLQKENLIEKKAHCICATLIKLTIRNARENKTYIKPATDLKLKKFEHTTYLHKLLV